MQISRAEVEKLAKLAHLELSRAEVGALTRDLNAIKAFVDRIKAAEDPSQIRKLPAPALPLARDRMETSLPRASALAEAPNHTDAAVVAPPLEAADRS